jgi:thiol-disulfide isomerase/thioredoxin
VTIGQWVLLVSLVLAVSFGLWRARTDGRFRPPKTPVVGDGPVVPVVEEGPVLPVVEEGPVLPVVGEGPVLPVVEEGAVLPVVEEGGARLETTLRTGGFETLAGARSSTTEGGFETLADARSSTTEGGIEEGGALPVVGEGSVLPVVEEGGARLETTLRTGGFETLAGARSSTTEAGIEEGGALPVEGEGAVLPVVGEGAVLPVVEEGGARLETTTSSEAHVTLLQFSSAFCAPCRATRRVLEQVASETDGVVHREIDAEENLDMVRQFGVLRTPTTVILDADGVERSRATGAPTLAQVRAALASLSGA